MWDKRTAVLTVLDGDTLIVDLDQGFGDRKQITLRLYGVWAPELSQPGGKETKAFVERWVAERKALSISSFPFVCTTMRVRDGSHEVMTFARYVGTLDFANESLNLAIEDFVQAGGYGGGTGA